MTRTCCSNHRTAIQLYQVSDAPLRFRQLALRVLPSSLLLNACVVLPASLAAGNTGSSPRVLSQSLCVFERDHLGIAASCLVRLSRHKGFDGTHSPQS